MRAARQALRSRRGFFHILSEAREQRR